MSHIGAQIREQNPQFPFLFHPPVEPVCSKSVAEIIRPWCKGSAVIFTLIQTAIEDKLAPYRYLTWLLRTAADLDLTNPQSLQQLLPWNVPAECKTN